MSIRHLTPFDSEYPEGPLNLTLTVTALVQLSMRDTKTVLIMNIGCEPEYEAVSSLLTESSRRVKTLYIIIHFRCSVAGLDPVESLFSDSDLKNTALSACLNILLTVPSLPNTID